MKSIPGTMLLTCWQKPKVTLDEYLLKLKHLGKDCNYKAVSTEKYRAEAIRDALISGPLSINI